MQWEKYRWVFPRKPESLLDFILLATIIILVGYFICLVGTGQFELPFGKAARDCEKACEKFGMEYYNYDTVNSQCWCQKGEELPVQIPLER